MDESTKDAIEEYYKLKKQYDVKQQKTKRKILQDESLDKKSKRVALSSLKANCVNCGKSGGTLFIEENNTLRALCQAEPKCDLNMNINRGSYKPFFPLYNNLNNESDKIRTNIVKVKLDMLFGYTNEDVAIIQFEEYRKEFSTIEEDVNELHKLLVSIIHNNRNKTTIKESKEHLATIKERIQLLIQEYKETQDAVMITNIVKEYIDELLPEAKRLRENKYAKNVIEKQDDLYILHQDPYLYTETEVQMSDI